MNGQVFWLTYASLWVVTLVLGILVILLYRQVGLVYLGSRREVEHGGVPIGGLAPTISVSGWGQPELSWAPETARRAEASLLIFTLPGCSICDDLAANISALHEAWQEDVEFIWIEREGLEPIPDRFGAAPELGVVSADEEAYTRWDVRAVPFAYLVDRDGRVAGRGLVNTPRAIAQLLGEHFHSRTRSRSKALTIDIPGASRASS